MADAALSLLLSNLSNILLSGIPLISDARHELKQLKTEIYSMIEDASKKQKEDLFKGQERILMDLIHKLEVTIDSYVSQAAVHPLRSLFQRALNPKHISLAKQVKVLRENEEFKTLIAAMASVSPVSDAPVTTTMEGTDKIRKKGSRQENLVGLNNDRDAIIESLNEKSEKLEIISIIGMPGIGKTTLARDVFQDPRVQNAFPTLIWVYVSPQLNRDDVFLTILKNFTKEDMSSKNSEDLFKLVYEYLAMAKFLMVMDDVWTAEEWDVIRIVLPMNNAKSKILITSINKTVADHANPNRQPYQLKYLDTMRSWELLKLEVFGRIDNFPPELEQVGILIAQKCKGIALAVKVISAILQSKICKARGNYIVMKKEWEAVAGSMDTTHFPDENDKHFASLSDEKKNVIYLACNEKLVDQIISWTYLELPYELRVCFLYLGMFPENTRVSARMLTQLWIAEGFIQSKEGKSLEETAQEYLEELFDWNLLMVDDDKVKINHEAKTCLIHDMVHEFCRKKAAFSNQNLFQEITMSKMGIFTPPIQIIEKYKRICIHSHVKEFFLKKPNVPTIRTLFCTSKIPILLGTKDNTHVSDSIPDLVRVLAMSTIKFPKFPTKVTQLVHLRYLNISCDELRVIPKAMSNLWNLRTLIVNTLSRTLKIKADIWMMIHLRHFITKASIILDTGKGIGTGCENLQILNKLSPQSCRDDVIHKAKNVKTLGVRGNLFELLATNFLEKFDHVDKLTLMHDVYPGLSCENPLKDLPMSNRFPPNLRILILSSTYLDWKHMSTLGKIETLKVLKLKNHAFMGNFLDSVGDDFDSLEILYISTTDLMFWRASSESFPKLKTLVVKNCTKLEEIPLDLKRSLQMLYMENVTTFAVLSARKIEQARKEIQAQENSHVDEFKLIIAPGDA